MYALKSVIDVMRLTRDIMYILNGITVRFFVIFSFKRLFFCYYTRDQLISMPTKPTFMATMLTTLASLSCLLSISLSFAITSLCHLFSCSFSTNGQILLVLNLDLKVESKLKLETFLISREASATSASTPMVATWSFCQAQYKAVSVSSSVTDSGSTLSKFYKTKI